MVRSFMSMANPVPSAEGGVPAPAGRFELPPPTQVLGGRGYKVLAGPIASIPTPTFDPILSQVTTRWELLTRELAAIYLCQMKANRNRVEALVKRYANDMFRGFWPVTHQGIAFDVENEMIDGQHRCWATYLSNYSHWVQVTRGLPLAAMDAMDKGYIRTAAHSLQIKQHKFGTSRAVAVARRMVGGPTRMGRKSKLSDAALYEFMDVHYDALSFALDISDKHHTPAPICACIARASYHVPLEKLKRFVDVVEERIKPWEMTPNDEPANALYKRRNHAGGNKGSSEIVSCEWYQLTQEAIRSMMSGRNKKDLRGGVTEDIFPLPKKVDGIANNLPGLESGLPTMEELRKQCGV